MANTLKRLKQNLTGPYYVDESCIDCDLCRMTAPLNFSRDGNSKCSFVSQQPNTPEEVKLCAQAKEECPVDAIGDDGANP